MNNDDDEENRVGHRGGGDDDDSRVCGHGSAAPSLTPPHRVSHSQS